MRRITKEKLENKNNKNLFPFQQQKAGHIYKTFLKIISFPTSISSFKELLSEAREKKDVTFAKESQKRSKGSDDDDLKYLEMTLVADKYTLSFHGDGTTKYLLMLANLVSLKMHSQIYIHNLIDRT